MSNDKSLTGYAKFELFLERCIRGGEAAIVLLLAILFLLGTIYQTLWIVWTNSAACREERFAQSLKIINENWKVGLIILIPLFYRAVRAFLERVEEVGTVKARKEKTTDPTKETNKGE